jgi:hypothetical protein
MQNFERKRRMLRASIDQDRREFFPPPSTDPFVTLDRLSYVNRHTFRSRKVTGCGILKYYITERGRTINCADSTVIGKVTGEVWKSATSAEKSEYIRLSDLVNKLIASQIPVNLRNNHPQI